MTDEAEQDAPYEMVEHTADVAIRVHGRDLSELFITAARALFALMTAHADNTDTERTITLEAIDAEALLVDWLNALLWLQETDGLTFTRFSLETLTPTRLIARVSGGPTTGKTLVVKAATFHNLHIERTERGVEALIVFDI